MNLRRAFSIMIKALREKWREPKMFVLMLLLPALLVLIYSIAYGQSGGMAQYLRLIVINQDAGPSGEQLVTRLREAEFDGKALFTIENMADRQAGLNSLAERRASYMLIIPPGFSADLAAGMPPIVEALGDPAYDFAVFSRTFALPAIDDFIIQARGLDYTWPEIMEFLPGTGTLSDLQFGIPGVMLFGVMFGVVTAALALSREDVGGTLRRLRLSRASAADLLVGVALAQIIEAIIQLALAFGVALLFGFRTPGSLALAIPVAALISLTATGLGLITACFSRNDGQAAMLGTSFLVPVVFLSNLMFPLPAMPIGQFAGRTWNVYDIFPTTHAGEALRRILVYGAGLDTLGFELLATFTLTAIYLGLGVLLYQRLRLGRRSA